MPRSFYLDPRLDISRKRRSVERFHLERRRGCPGHLGQPFRDPHDCEGFEFWGPINGIASPHLREREESQPWWKGNHKSWRILFTHFLFFFFHATVVVKISNFWEREKKKDRENYVRRNVRENKFLIFKGKPTLHLFGGIDFDRGYTMDSNTRILLLTCGCLSPLVNTHGCLIGRF